MGKQPDVRACIFVILNLKIYLMRRTVIIEIIAILIACLFLYTGISKLWSFAFFRAQLRDSPWNLLVQLSNYVAWTLPIVELLLVCLLIFPATRKAGLLLSALLFGVFIGYLTILLNSGVQLPCLCGGIVDSMSWKSHLYFDTFFLSLSILGLFLEKNLSQGFNNKTANFLSNKLLKD